MRIDKKCLSIEGLSFRRFRPAYCWLAYAGFGYPESFDGTHNRGYILYFDFRVLITILTAFQGDSYRYFSALKGDPCYLEAATQEVDPFAYAHNTEG